MELSRREFIKASAAAAVFSALEACAPKATPSPVAPTATTAPSMKPTATAAAAAATGKLVWSKGVCRFCGVGCGVLNGVKDGKLVAVKGDPDCPVNKGLLCIKGINLPDIVYAVRRKDRLTKPLIRRNGKLVEASWDEALDLVATKFKEAIEKYGPNSVAYYGSGQAFTEESYTANKLFKAGIGTNNVEGNPRLCMASAVGGYVTTFGLDEPCGAYEDIEQAECILLAGSNTSEQHPIVFNRVADHKQKNADTVKVIVADPRKTPTAKIADLHLSFIPGTDLAIYNSMAYVLVKEGLIDRDFIDKHVHFKLLQGDKWVDGTFDDYVKFLEDYTPEAVAKLSGVAAEDIVKAARWFGKAKTAMSLWTMGLNQRTRGVWANNLMHNLHLITGKICKPGSTPFSLTGQPNACGGVRETGSLAHLLPAHRVVKNEKHRQEMAKLWGVPADRIQPKPGKHTIAMFRALESGDIKAILILCTNPGQSLPNLNRYRPAIEKAFSVVTEIVHPTRTTELADVVLPAAFWVEKEGVFGNSERRSQHTAQAIQPPGEAKSDLWILVQIAKRLGHGDLIPFESYEDAWNDYLKTTAGTDMDLSGATYDRLRKTSGGAQWPVPTPDHPGTARRYVAGEDPFVKEGIDFYGKPDHRAIVWARPQKGPAEPVDDEYPVYLTTGRVLEQWHSGTMTMEAPKLAKAVPAAYVEINPDDAKKWGVKERDMVKIISRRGTLTLPAKIRGRATPRPGVIFVPWFDADKLINLVTIDAFDPGSKQPEFKICAVKVEKA
jgi:nitrate reductase NapA